MANYTRIGFGQVEPTHLSAQRTGQIYGQLPAAASYDLLENGQFVKYDYAAGECNTTGAGEWMLVFNEVKLYDGWRETYKDFAMQKKNYVPGTVGNDHTEYPYGTNGTMTPRVFKTNVGDIMTTNCLGLAATSNTGVTDSGIAEADLVAGKFLKVGTAGYLVKATSATDGDMVWVITQNVGGKNGYNHAVTMADGQKAVRIQRIK